MALEDITAGHTIANLVLTNPADGDDASQGDDHLRNIKKSLQYTFPNISATASGVAAEFAFAHKGGTVSGNAVILGTLSASGAVNFATTLSVSGAAVMKSAVTLESSLTVNGTLSVSGAAVMKSAVTLESSLTVSGALVVKGSTNICPIGSILMYGGTTAPAGFLLCNGAEYTTTGSYSLLFGVIGNAFGIGAGETSTASTILFNVPDLRGRVPVGLDNLGGTSANRITGAWADVLGSASGSEVVVLTVAEMPAHTHTIGTSNSTGAEADKVARGSTTGASTQTTSSTGGDGAHNNVQPSIALGYIIRAGA